MWERERSRAPSLRWRVPKTKVVPPRLPGHFVHRDELRNRLAAAAVSHDLTLVCAPAGYGKTLLLADWVDATGCSDKAWVSLDSDDDSAENFLAAVLCALREHVRIPVTGTLPDQIPPPGDDIATAVAELVDAIETVPGRVCLVLDNVQEVPSRGALRVLTALVRNQPRNLRLVLACRSDPPLPLAKLRVQGRVAELRATELRFLPGDGRELLSRSGVTLTDDQFRRLLIQTDGWVAGLRLAARSLRHTDDPERFLPHCASNDHAMADFLAGEVLADLPHETRTALRMLSVCDKLTPQLATLLTGRDDVGDLLAGLEREGALVTALSGEEVWYQLHPMLRAYLRADLARHQPELATVLHERAAAWFAAQDQPFEALRHAESTEDERAAVTLLHDKGTVMLLDGRPELVLRGLDAAGPAAVARDPWLLLFSALAHLELGDLTAAESDIARCSRAWPSSAEARLVSFRRLVTSAHTMACGRPPVTPGATDAGVGGSAALEAWRRLDHGVSLIAADDRAGARRELQFADRLSSEYDLKYLVMHTHAARALLAAAQGDYAGMEQAAERAGALAGERTREQSPWLTVCHVMLGLVRLLRLDPVAAGASVQKLADTESRAMRFAAGVIEGAARFDRGDRPAGLELIHGSRDRLGDSPVPRELAAMALLLEHQCALTLARFPLARDVAEWGARRLGATAEVHLVTARTLFARGDLAGAGRALRAARDRGAVQVVPTTEVELCLLEAAVALQLECRTRARGALAEALERGAAAGIVRPFEYAERDVRRLLLDQVGGFGDAEAFAARVRRALAGAGRDGVKVVLTGRERAVLVRLTSPQPLDEVAVALEVSINTIKTHVRAIYAKLGVNTRRAAVTAARELGLG